jgi:hypothetical protein
MHLPRAPARGHVGDVPIRIIHPFFIFSLGPQNDTNLCKYVLWDKLRLDSLLIKYDPKNFVLEEQLRIVSMCIASSHFSLMLRKREYWHRSYIYAINPEI